MEILSQGVGKFPHQASKVLRFVASPPPLIFQPCVLPNFWATFEPYGKCTLRAVWVEGLVVAMAVWWSWKLYCGVEDKLWTVASLADGMVHEM